VILSVIHQEEPRHFMLLVLDQVNQVSFVYDPLSSLPKLVPAVCSPLLFHLFKHVVIMMNPPQ